jgi:hypothetical protein
MPQPHRYRLQPYKAHQSRIHCPECNHPHKTFTRYIDTQTGNHLATHVGLCNRLDKCGYHYSPRQYFQNNVCATIKQPPLKPQPLGGKGAAFSHLPTRLVNNSLTQSAYSHNNFILFLRDVFGLDRALQAAKRYKIGTAKLWPGATVFWQIDALSRIRTGKIMLYSQSTGKRVKQPFNHVNWVHNCIQKSKLKSQKVAAIENQPSPYLLRQCFFGEHLLYENTTATVAITESEKTAVMASIMMPQFIWLAAGSLHGLDEHKCRALQNRTVLLFPDVNAYGLWAQRATFLNLKMPTTTFAVHQEMEITATPEERANGADMGDRWTAEHLTTAN